MHNGEKREVLHQLCTVVQVQMKELGPGYVEDEQVQWLEELSQILASSYIGESLGG